MAQTDGERKLAAILSADVAGYSRLMADDEAATVRTLGDFRAVFADHIARHKGRVVDSPGDNLLAEFASPVEAVACALEVQRELARRNAQLAEHRRMHFRIGVNLGDVIDQDGALYGDGVNLAARLEALAEAGGICVSGMVYEAVEGKIEAAFEDFGTREVKNIPKPVRVFRVVVGKHSRASDTLGHVLSHKPVIAVLPFLNLSGDPDQEYFADGIAEDLLTALSRVRWLSVIARNSSFTYKGRSVDVKQVERELGARYVVEGSVRKGGQRVRISAQLIDAATGAHLWAERYDRELADIFAVQDEITEALVAAIEPELAAAERERAHRKPPENLDAWDCYQRGMWHLWRFTAEDNAEARRFFERAVEHDPGFAAAHAGLGWAHTMDVVLGFRPGYRLSRQEALAAARMALSLDEKDALAHVTLGRAYIFFGDYANAIAELGKGIALNPSFALAHHILGLAHFWSGEPNAAFAEVDIAARLSPHDPFFWFFDMVKATCCILRANYDEAFNLARAATRHPTAGYWAFAALGSALGYLGRVEEAGPVVARLRELKPDFSRAFIESVFPNSDPRAVGSFIDGLRKAGWTPQD